MTIKVLLVGRHGLLLGQEEAIERYLGETPRLVRIPYVENVKGIVRFARSYGVQAIVVQSLPPATLAALAVEAERHGIPVLLLKMREKGIVDDEEEAKAWAAADHRNRAYVARNGGYRLVEFQGLYLVKVKIHEERVA